MVLRTAVAKGSKLTLTPGVCSILAGDGQRMKVTTDYLCYNVIAQQALYKSWRRLVVFPATLVADAKLTMRVASHAVDVATILRDKECVLVPASQTLNYDVERADLG